MLEKYLGPQTQLWSFIDNRNLHDSMKIIHPYQNILRNEGDCNNINIHIKKTLLSEKTTTKQFKYRNIYRHINFSVLYCVFLVF